MRQCEVYVKKIYAGLLTEDDNGKYTFAYDDEYLSKADLPAVSLTLPKQKAPYESNVLFSCFFNILSEGENRKFQSQLLHIDENDDFGILMETAQYDTIGSITVKPLNGSHRILSGTILCPDQHPLPSANDKVKVFSMEKIGKIIRQRRLELGINQQTLADLAGVGINTIVSTERGTGNPSYKVLESILNTLGLTLEIKLKTN